MTASISWRERLRFLLTTGGLYIGAVALMGYAGVVATPSRPTLATQPPAAVQKTTPPQAGTPEPAVISGKPIRLVIPDAAIDLPIDEGYYDASSDSWTLSDSRLQYATMTMPANNHSGNTFIYGHGTDQVLAPLSRHTPAAGSPAQIYTDNGQIFTYIFQSAHDFTPDDTSIFNYDGPPILTVQTCTGAASEWRTMYTFTYEKVAMQ